MAMKLFEKNPDGLASVADRIRGLTSLACCIGSFVGANYAQNVQWQVFFMIVGILTMCLTIGIVFKDMD